MEKTQKAIYEKWWFWLIVVVIVAGAVSSFTEKESEEVSTQENESQEKKDNEEPADLSREDEIENLISEIVEDDFMATEIKEIAVNPDLGKEDGNFIILPKFKWEMSNKTKKTREMLEEYSDHLAAKLANESDINEITIFWEVPYHLEDENVAKYSYERAGDKMTLGEKWYAPKLRE